MTWVNVKDKLPEYNVPVFLKNSDFVFVGMRDSTDIKGEHYLLLKKPDFEVTYDKMTHWAQLIMPIL